MRGFSRHALLWAALILLVSCANDPIAPSRTGGADGVLPEPASFEPAAIEAIRMAGWEIDPLEAPAEEGAPTVASRPLPLITGFSRDPLGGDIVHYHWEVKTGPGFYDVIGIHRVVRESRPGRPIRTDQAILFQHGCCKDFVGVYQPGLYSPNMPDDWGIAFYLASHDVDVWGIDQSWTLVPEDETDFSFMADWGLEQQMGNVHIALSMARQIRRMTGSGNAKMILSGYSNGIPSTVGLVDVETQLPPGRRQIGGYIPVDMPLRLEPGPIQEGLYGYVTGYYLPQWQAGVYNETNLFPPVVELFECCPDEPSPFAEGLTNRQFAYWMSCGPVADPEITSMHYWGGIFEGGMPVALRYTDESVWRDFLRYSPTWEPMIWGIEWISYVTGHLDTPYDDHFAEVTIPVLNVTPAGGYADATAYGLALLGSTDIETLMPTMGDPPLEDFAHVDLFTAPQAEALVWAPILVWIEAHPMP